MNEQDKLRNQAAINRIEGKLDELLLRRKLQWIFVALIIITLLICTAINVYADKTIQKMQIDELNQIELRQEVSAVETEPVLTSLGEFKITHYCPCVKCCGKTDGITYTGTQATAGRTIGVDPDVIPLGSTVYIDGQAYVAEDTGGGIDGRHIDMFVDSHEEALSLGVKYAEVMR